MPRQLNVEQPNGWVPKDIKILDLSSATSDTAEYTALFNSWLSADQYTDKFPTLNSALAQHNNSLSQLLSSDPTQHAVIALSNGAYASGNTALFLGGLTYKDTPTESSGETAREITSWLVPARYRKAGIGAKLLAAAERADTADGGSPTTIQVVNTQGEHAAARALAKSGYDRIPGSHRWSKVTSAQATSESHQVPEKGLTTVSADRDTHQGLTGPNASVAAETQDAKTAKGPQETRTTGGSSTPRSKRYRTLEERVHSLLSQINGSSSAQ